MSNRFHSLPVNVSTVVLSSHTPSVTLVDDPDFAQRTMYYTHFHLNLRHMIAEKERLRPSTNNAKVSRLNEYIADTFPPLVFRKQRPA